MRRFTKSLQEASHKYLNHSKPKPPTTPGRKTDAIFEDQSNLFNQDDSKKPGIFRRIGSGMKKLSNANLALQRFNQDAEEHGTLGAASVRMADQEQEQNPGNNNGLFNQQQTNQQQTNQQQPGGADIQWQNWARNAWPKIPAEAKKFFGDDMNKFIEYKKQEASLRQQGVNI